MTIAQTEGAKIAELELALAQARHFVRHCEIDPESSAHFKEAAREVRERSERLLDGTIHCFKGKS